MFNWFRRQKVQPEQEQAPPAPVEETPSEATPTTSEATSQEEYLDWAKKAFKIYLVSQSFSQSGTTSRGRFRRRNHLVKKIASGFRQNAPQLGQSA